MFCLSINHLIFYGTKLKNTKLTEVWKSRLFDPLEIKHYTSVNSLYLLKINFTHNFKSYIKTNTCVYLCVCV